MNNHPLFEGFINSGLESAGAKMGFRVCVVSSMTPLYPMTTDAAEHIQRTLELNGGPDGFYRVACWQVPGLYMAAFAKPLTGVAMACYLAGLGAVAQKQHKLHQPRYRYSYAGCTQPQGWADDRNQAAERGERAALERDQTEYQTHRVRAPLPSWLYSGAAVLEDLRLAAFECVGAESGDWPKLPPNRTGQFVEAHALLVDGFAWHAGQMPDFYICDGEPVQHRVWSGV